MGAAIAKPNPPDTSNEAHANCEACIQGLHAEAERFFLKIRLGEATSDTLGYKLTEQRLTAQEKRLMVQTQMGAPDKATLNKIITEHFGVRWSHFEVVGLQAIQAFFGADVKPSESAVNDTLSSSFLVFEHSNVVQYSMFIRRTSATSMGTFTGDSQLTMMVALCKGNIDFASVDPQTIISTLLEQDERFTEGQIDHLLQTIVKELELAARLSEIKQNIFSSQGYRNFHQAHFGQLWHAPPSAYGGPRRFNP